MAHSQVLVRHNLGGDVSGGLEVVKVSLRSLSGPSASGRGEAWSLPPQGCVVGTWALSVYFGGLSESASEASYPYNIRRP